MPPDSAFAYELINTGPFGRSGPCCGTGALSIGRNRLRVGRKSVRYFIEGSTECLPTQATVTIKHLAAALAEQHEMAKKQSQEIVNDTVELVTKHLKKGNRVRIAGLGILQVRKRPARMGRNPATGEPTKIAASKKIAFRAARDLKEAI